MRDSSNKIQLKSVSFSAVLWPLTFSSARYIQIGHTTSGYLDLMIIFIWFLRFTCIKSPSLSLITLHKFVEFGQVSRKSLRVLNFISYLGNLIIIMSSKWLHSISNCIEECHFFIFFILSLRLVTLLFLHKHNIYKHIKTGIY